MRRFFLLSLSYLVFLSATEIQAKSIQPFDMAALSILEASKDPSILGIEDGNVYLNSAHISVNENGIFLSTREHVLLQLASIFCHEAMVYTRISNSEPALEAVWPITITCSNCGRKFGISIYDWGEHICPHCGAKN
jgi:hypothetical protein